MNTHPSSQHFTRSLRKYLLPVFIGCCSLGAASSFAQTSLVGTSGIHVGIDWHTMAEPRYGASFDYTWNNVQMRSKDGAEVLIPISLRISRTEGGGLFYLQSDPIAVPLSGMIITFDSRVVMHPSDAERGTSLSDDPNAGCKRFQDGITRASYHQVISILDAQTEKSLAPAISDHHFEIMRLQVLNDIDRTDNIAIDLSAFAGKQVKIQTIVSAGYNGRGPSKATEPVLEIIPSSHQDPQ